MTDEHLSHLLPDYALGLLTAEDRRRVERHAGQCAACRAALRRERLVGALVRDTARAATPAPGRLRALRPAAPRPRPAPLYARLAPATMIAALLALVLLFGRGASPFTPSVFADNTPTLTATGTQTPTATSATSTTAATNAATATDITAATDAPTATEIAARPAMPAPVAPTPVPPPLP